MVGRPPAKPVGLSGAGKLSGVPARVLRCHRARALVLNGEMEWTEAEKRKARHVQRLLYALVAILIVVPAIIYFLRLP